MGAGQLVGEAAPRVRQESSGGGGSIQIGWTKARIELEACSFRCFKCLEKGHVKETCPSTVDRSARCYRCGGLGHVAKGCTAQKPGLHRPRAQGGP